MRLPLQLRSSSLDRIFSCNGSLVAAPLVPPAPDSAESTSGQVVHFLTAARLVEELGATPPEGGLVAPKLPPGYKLPAFDAWIVDWAFRLVEESIPRDWSLMVEPEFAYRYDLPRPVWIEATEIDGPIPPEFTLKDGKVLVDHAIITSHLDVLALSPDCTEARAFDWKAGIVGADSAESNWQAGSYLGQIKQAWPEINLARFTLGQPKIDEEATGIQRISHVELNGSQLDAMNLTIAEHVNRALENRFTTDDSPKACRYCPVGLRRPWLCPSLQLNLTTMQATLTPEAIQALKDAPNDAQLGDFVLSGRTLTAPVKAATELLQERIAAQGYVDAGCGTRITIKETGGDYEIVDPLKFLQYAKEDLGTDERIAKVFTPAMGALKDELADALNLKKTSKVGPSAASRFDERYRPLTKQGVRKTLVLT